VLVQGLFSSPADLPQYGMNVTTLLVPLYGISVLSKRIIAPGTPYVDLHYRQALALSSLFQGGIVAWVAIWAFYGQGFTLANFSEVAKFSAAYMSVIVVEPLADLGILALAKVLHRYSSDLLFHLRLHRPA
jgi:hypothetical protein